MKTVLITLLIAIFLIAPAYAENEKEEVFKPHPVSEDFLTAAAMGELDLAEKLLAAGADINYLDYEGWGALHWSVRAERPKSVKFLIAKGAAVDLPTKYENYTPLHMVSKTNYRLRKNRLNIADMLLKAGADANAKDESGTRPIHMAVTRGFSDLVIKLIQFGAEVSAETGYHKLTPLHEACTAGYTKLVKILISMSADVNAQGRSGWTPLHAAGNADVAKLLIAAGAKVNAVSGKGLTPLSEAVSKGQRELAELLISKGANVNYTLTKTNRNLLHYAGSPDVAELLIENGLFPEAADTWGYTPLHTAVMRSNVKMVKYFVEKGLDHNAKIRWHIRNDEFVTGSTPLDIALDSEPKSDVVKYLQGLNAKTGRYLPGNLYYEDLGDREIELFRAVRNGQLTTIKNRLNKGANVNAVDNAGWSPLHYAAYFGRIWTVGYLIKRGAKVNKFSEKRISRKYPTQQTPLDVAITAGKKEIIEKLKSLGGLSRKDMPSDSEYKKTIEGIKNLLKKDKEEEK